MIIETRQYVKTVLTKAETYYVEDIHKIDKEFNEKLSPAVYKQVLQRFFSKYLDLAIEEGYKLPLPYTMGYLEVVKEKAIVSFNEEGDLVFSTHYRNLQDGTFILDHEYKATMRWIKPGLKNKNRYNFKPYNKHRKKLFYLAVNNSPILTKYNEYKNRIEICSRKGEQGQTAWFETQRERSKGMDMGSNI